MLGGGGCKVPGVQTTVGKSYGHFGALWLFSDYGVFLFIAAFSEYVFSALLIYLWRFESAMKIK